LSGETKASKEDRRRVAQWGTFACDRTKDFMAVS
jgi:hypothetical protein